MRNLQITLAAILGTAISAAALAAPPWARLIPFKNVEADVNQDYKLSDANGPWMIMATSFSGPGAAQDAHNLVLELRKEYNMEAYVYEQAYDFTQKVDGLGYNQYGERKKMRYADEGKYTSIAVLVGNFESVDDGALEKTLEKLKDAQPKCLSGDQSQTSQHDAIKYLRRKIQEAVTDKEKKEKGPMGHAFVSRNPLLPDEYFQQKGIEPLVLKMNEGVANSLLDCEGKYSVRVATFAGATEVDAKKIAEIESKNIVSGSRLAVAAEKAERLTAKLRKQGVPAYVFHDRSESIVTVGSFSSVGAERADGKMEIDPQINRIINDFRATPVAGTANFTPKTIDGVPFDVQPVPVTVPKKSVGGDYAKWNFLK
ncbi:hypothetical protein LOC68_04160 [Blastopirellula sp. JC732]|uniref:Uncharacterized protein n=1 Tax=Blastopirellula sediminis TaxID=2894196 RepID=A0A9X1MIV1_9BACT|nr:hypothetical protein [Blastopirellula sediminis]MCC9609648.1 hypothetical protein [Blastopirellula sediminis]MCC9627576.1 hypothetical protein [Blastopirellula sediminis]